MTSRVEVDSNGNEINHDDLVVEAMVNENYGLVQDIVTDHRNLINSIVDWDDLVQWGLIGLWNAARAHTPERGAFSTVAFTSIRHEIWKGYKATCSNKKESVFADAPDEFDLPEVSPSQCRGWIKILFDVDEATLWQAISHLPDRQQEILKKHFYQKYTLEEIGLEMGCTKENIRQIQDKATATLKRLLDGEGVDQVKAVLARKKKKNV